MKKTQQQQHPYTRPSTTQQAGQQIPLLQNMTENKPSQTYSIGMYDVLVRTFTLPALNPDIKPNLNICAAAAEFILILTCLHKHISRPV